MRLHLHLEFHLMGVNITPVGKQPIMLAHIWGGVVQPSCVWE